MTSIFKIKREEWPTAIVTLLVVGTLSALLISGYPSQFFLAHKSGVWSIFHSRFCVSGFDEFSYMFISAEKIYYQLDRHPLYGVVLWPLYWLNQGLMDLFNHNCTVYLMAVLEGLCAIWSSVLFHRICRELVETSLFDARLLTAMLFSFAYVTLSTFVPDHFGLSMTCLMATIYIIGARVKSGKTIGAWQTFGLFLITAGVSLSNGVKVGLATLFSNGWKVFRPKFLLVSFVLPMAIMGGLYWLQYEQILVPQNEKATRIIAKQLKKDPKMFEKSAKHRKWIDEHKSKPIAEEGVLRLTDTNTPRLQTITDNVFGESLQLHQQHLLEDLNFTRPTFVPYDWVVNYVVEVVIVLLLLFGIVCGLDQKLLWMLLSWVGFGAVIHLVLGFGINEVYIMSAHWLFLIPIAIGYALVRCARPLAIGVRVVTLLLTLYLWAYNGTLIVQYLTSPIAPRV